MWAMLFLGAELASSRKPAWLTLGTEHCPPRTQCLLSALPAKQTACSVYTMQGTVSAVYSCLRLACWTGLSTEQPLETSQSLTTPVTLCKPLCAHSYGHSSQTQFWEVATLGHDFNFRYPSSY